MPISIPTVSNAYLATASELPAPPFYVALNEANTENYLCQQVYRHLPKKRLVLKLHDNSNTIVSKIFYRKKDFDREVRGQKWLVKKALPTPSIITAKKNDSKSWIVNYELIAAPSIATVMVNTSTEDQQKLLIQCCQLVASMHGVGLYQEDIHLDNFLYEHNKIWIIDTASIKNKKKVVRKKLALKNLGLLLAQQEKTQSLNLAVICQNYNEALNSFEISPKELANAITTMQRKRWQHYKKKLTRSCSEFFVTKQSQRFSVVRKDHRSDELEKKLESIDQWLESGERLKSGNTATTAKVEYNGKYFVIKRYNIKSWRHAISRSFRQTRGWSSWHNANYLRFCNIKTPLPIALIEQRFGFLRRRAWLLSEFTPGIDLLEASKPSSKSPIPQDQLPALTANIVAQLLHSTISHGDMKATNFIVTVDNIQLIDLDSMKIHRSKQDTIDNINTDIQRLLRNWQDTNISQLYSDALFEKLGNSVSLPKP